MEKNVECKPFQSLIELFQECFPSWKVRNWVCTGLNEIRITLENGHTYDFGTNDLDDIYLNRIDSQKMQAS